MGARDAAICREMTKLHEEILRAPVAELAAAADTLETRGEFVLVIGPPAARAQAMTEDALDDLLRSSCSATASRMRWRMRSNCPAGRAAKSMPARSNSPNRPTSQRRTMMAKTDGAMPPEKLAKVAAPERVAAFRTGLSAEARAAAWLMAKGYRILAKRFRTPHGEIDLVARKRDLVAFIEVKARASLDDAAYAVTPRQQARIIAAAQAWLMAHPEHAEFELRFDAVLIAPRRCRAICWRHSTPAPDASDPHRLPPTRGPPQ